MEHVSSSLTVVQDDPPFWTKTACLQLGYGLWVNLTVIGIGLAFGWPAVAVPQLLEEEAMHMTLDDQAWVASVLTLFSPIGCLISGYLLDKYGRRYLLIFCQLPIGAGWIYTGFASSPLHIVLGRIITGIGLGFAYSAPRVYITEITLPNMRGVIGAFPNIGVAVGIMIQAALGSFLRWYVLCFIGGIYSFSLLLMYLLIPETPYYILMKSNADDAKVALKKFRSKKFNIDQEIEDLKDFKDNNDIRRLTFKQQMKEIIKTSTCKPFGIGLSYIILMQTSGVNVITMWGVEMLEIRVTVSISLVCCVSEEGNKLGIERAHASIDSHLGNVILAATRVIFGIITSMLLYKVGRRVLALSSAIGVGLVSMVLAAYLYLFSKEAIYPLILFTAYMAFASLGYYILPMLVLFELLPLQVRGILSGPVMAMGNFLMFSMNQFYPHIRDSLGLHVTMAIFGTISLLGAVLLFFILPETKGLTLQEIEEYFNARRPTLISSRQYIKTQSLSSSSLDLTRLSSYERKKIRNMRSLLKTQQHHENKGENEEYGKLKTIFEAKEGDKKKLSKEDSKKGVVFKEPSEPGDKEPSEPGDKEPSKPDVKEPSKPDVKEPSKLDAKEPSKQDNKPSKPDVEEPSEPDVKEPSTSNKKDKDQENK